MDCDVQQNVDFIWQSGYQFSGSTDRKLQSTSKAKSAPKRRAQSLFNGLWLVWSNTASWIPVKPWHLSKLSKLMRRTDSRNACGWHWSTEWALFSTTMPNYTLRNQHFRSWAYVYLWLIPVDVWRNQHNTIKRLLFN